jgi:hypothetical protein
VAVPGQPAPAVGNLAPASTAAQRNLNYPNRGSQEIYDFVAAANRVIDYAAAVGKDLQAPRTRGERAGHEIIAARTLFDHSLGLASKTQRLNLIALETGEEAKELKGRVARVRSARVVADKKKRDRKQRRIGSGPSPHIRTVQGSPDPRAIVVATNVTVEDKSPRRRKKAPSRKKATAKKAASGRKRAPSGSETSDEQSP